MPSDPAMKAKVMDRESEYLVEEDLKSAELRERFMWLAEEAKSYGYIN